ncbi:hypothetical protein [Planococcus sp. YIM B11945]|uniref:hypothetical protein n=1 Tax=Planococcus sp. YIM B11945 TaxID=3435410 RepID=UPI003D7C5F08
MSLASYIGCNRKIPLSPEGSEELIVIGHCFSDKFNRRNVQKYQFSTPYIYEVSSDWGIAISDELNKDSNREAKEKLIKLCEIMDAYLDEGDFFELYSCWVGEEQDKRTGEMTLQIGRIDLDTIELPEKTLARIEK